MLSLRCKLTQELDVFQMWVIVYHFLFLLTRVTILRHYKVSAYTYASRVMLSGFTAVMFACFNVNIFMKQMGFSSPAVQVLSLHLLLFRFRFSSPAVWVLGFYIVFLNVVLVLN